jgi:hypothetical protein
VIRNSNSQILRVGLSFLSATLQCKVSKDIFIYDITRVVVPVGVGSRRGGGET